MAGRQGTERDCLLSRVVASYLTWRPVYRRDGELPPLDLGQQQACALPCGLTHEMKAAGSNIGRHMRTDILIVSKNGFVSEDREVHGSVALAPAPSRYPLNFEIIGWGGGKRGRGTHTQLRNGNNPKIGEQAANRESKKGPLAGPGGGTKYFVPDCPACGTFLTCDMGRLSP